MNPISLRIGGVPEHFNLPIRKAIDENVFNKINLDLNWTDYKGGTGEMVKALEGNDIDIAILLTEGAVKAAFDKKCFKIIQVYVNTPLYWGIYSGVNTQHLDLAMIESQKFCISRYGSGSHLMAYLLCQNQNWNVNQVEFVEVGKLESAVEYLQENPEYLFLWERFMTKPFVDQDKLKKLGEIPTPWASFCIVVRNDILESNELILKEFLESLATYTYKFKQHTLDSIDYISNYFGFNIPDMRDWIMNTDWNYVLDPPQAKLLKAVDFLKAVQLIDPHSDLAQICPNDDFWNIST